MKNKRLWFGGLCAAIIGTASFLFPEKIIERKINRDLNIVRNVQEYYNTPVVFSRQEKLSYEDKISLIAKRDECEVEYPAEDIEGVLDKEEILDSVANCVVELYDEGLLPLSIASGYQNWFGKQAVLMKYTDTYFGNYSVLVWEVDFLHYEGNHGYKVLADAESASIYGIYTYGMDFTEEMKELQINYRNKDISEVFSSFFFLITQEMGIYELTREKDEFAYKVQKATGGEGFILRIQYAEEIFSIETVLETD